MEETMFMHVLKSFESLVDDRFELVLWELSCSILDQLVHVHLHVLEDKVEVIIDSDDFF